MGDHVVVRQIGVIDDLDGFEARPIVEGNEANGPGVAVGSYPSFDEDFVNLGEVFVLTIASIELGQ